MSFDDVAQAQVELSKRTMPAFSYQFGGPVLRIGGGLSLVALSWLLGYFNENCSFQPRVRTWSEWYIGENSTFPLPSDAQPWLNHSDPQLAREGWGNSTEGFPLDGKFGEHSMDSRFGMASYRLLILLAVGIPCFEVLWGAVVRVCANLGPPKSRWLDFFDYYRPCGFVRIARLVTALGCCVMAGAVMAVLYGVFWPWSQLDSCNPGAVSAQAILSGALAAIGFIYAFLLIVDEAPPQDMLLSNCLFFAGITWMSVKRQRQLEQEMFI